jgi:hypothetical protein
MFHYSPADDVHDSVPSSYVMNAIYWRSASCPMDCADCVYCLIFSCHKEHLFIQKFIRSFATRYLQSLARHNNNTHFVHERVSGVLLRSRFAIVS